MIEDLDETIKQLLIREGGLDPAEIDVSFDVPDREWSASIVKPTLNFYLYDVRENVVLRDMSWETLRRGNGTLAKKHPPRRIDCSYLLTAWTSSVEDEHRLLSSTLQTLFRFSVIPQDVLQGSLASQPLPVPMSVGQPDGVLKNPADVWTALDNQLKPAINYMATLAVDVSQVIEGLVPVTTRVITLMPPPANGNGVHTLEQEQRQEAGRTQTATATSHYVDIGGTVYDNEHRFVAGASVMLHERGSVVRTDAEGRFIFRGLRYGRYTLVASTADRAAQPVKVDVPPTQGANSYDLTV